MTKSETEYLAKLELEAGGKIINKAMIRLSPESTEIEARRETYGLLVITDETLLFKHFAGNNWLSSLMTTSSSEGNREKEISLLIRKKTISDADIVRETGFWKRILRPVKPFFAFSYRDSNGVAQRLSADIVHCEQGDDSFLSDLGID